MITTAPSGPARWAQLTYTSFDDGIRAGGWQVKQTSGSLNEDEQNRLRSQVVTGLDLVVKLPSFPTQDEISELPRRLVHVADANGGGRYWHTVFAGPDATGRPGNVFVHALLDRGAHDDLSFRPIHLWRSADWLSPYGAESVRDAVLGPLDRPRVGDAITAQAVIDFVLDPNEWRIGVLAALLDAVAAAMRGGPRIVLGVDTPDSAAAWIGAVSHLTSGALAGRLSFSTFERASELEASWSRGVLLAAVPSIDLPDVKVDIDSAHTVVVIDSGEAVSLGALGQQPHSTAAGSNIEVTSWSVLAEAAFLDEETAGAVLHEIDVVGASVTTNEANPEWPLAAAMSTVPDQPPDVVSAVRAALLSGPPRDLSRFTALADRVAGEVRQEIGDSAEKAWDAVRAGVRTPTYDIALHSYLQLALNDPSWLAQSPQAPVPALTVGADEALGREFDRVLGERLGELGRGVVDVAAVAGALRVLDFGVRAGLTDPERPLSWTPDVQRLIFDHLAPALLGPRSAELIRMLPPPPPEPVRAAIVDAVDATLLRRPPMAQLPELSSDVWTWLFGSKIPAFDVRQLTPIKSESVNGTWPRPSAAAYILWLARVHGHEPTLPPFVRACALWFALDAQECGFADAEQDVARFARFEIDAVSAECLIGDFGPAVPPGTVLAALETAAWPQVRSLAETVSRIRINLGRWTGPTAHVVQALARVRIRAQDTGRRDGAWAAGVRADLESVLTSGLISEGTAARSWRNLLAAAVLIQYLVGIQSRFDEARAWTPPKGLYGTAIKPPFAEPVYYAGSAVDELQNDPSWADDRVQPPPKPGLPVETWQPPRSSPHPRPVPHRPSEPAAVSLDELKIDGVVGRIVADALRAAPGSVVLDWVLPPARARAFDNDAIFALALITSPESGLTRRSKFRGVHELLLFPTRDYDSVGEALMVELLRSGRAEVDPRRMDSLIDRVGQAEYGIDAWSRRDSERTDLTRFSRRYFKYIQALSEVGPQADRPRGGLRRNH